MDVKTLEMMYRFSAERANEDLENWFKEQLAQLERTKRDLESFLESARKSDNYSDKANRVTSAVGMLQQQTRGLDEAVRVARMLEQAHATGLALSVLAPEAP